MMNKYGEINLLNAEARLDEFLQQIDQYITSSKIVYSSYKEEYSFYADMEMSELSSKTRVELVGMAYMLQGYASYIQDEYNKHTSILNWCNSFMDELLVKYERDTGFPQYTKFEMKKTIMISENSFTEKLEELRKISQMRVTLLEGKVFQIKKMSDILMEKSRL